MKLFYNPSRHFAPIAVILLIAAIAAGGRSIRGDGDFWTFCAAISLAGINAFLASNWPTLNQLGARYGQWLKGGVIFTLLSAVVLTAATVAAGQISHARNPHYTYYDLFLITAGDAPFMDTNGESYMVPDAGQTATTIALSILLTFVVFCVAGLTGIAVGLSDKNGGSNAILIGTAVVAGVTGGIMLAALAPSKQVAGELLTDPVPNTGAIVSAVLTAILAVGTAWVIARTPRYRC